MENIRKAAIYITAISLCVMLTVYADTSLSAAKEAIERCLNILIPSLFIFMAVSGLLIRTGAYKILSLPFYPIARFVYKMPYELFSVMLISNLAGFPIGASMLGELTDNGSIDKSTASVMQCFCYAGGPSFSIGVIGLFLYNDKRIGLIVWLSTFLSNLIAALILCWIFRLKPVRQTERTAFSSEDLIKCTENAGSSMLMICGLVIIFCVCMADVQRLFGSFLRINSQKKSLIKTVFELSSITSLNNASYELIPIITALFSFGGVCVLIQMISTVKGRYPLTLFFITRLPISLLSGFIAGRMTDHFIEKAEYCISARKDFIVNFNNFIPSVCLILMIFLLLFKKGVAFFRDM